MADISRWQATLELSKHVVNPNRLATEIYECSLTIFLRLVQPSLAEPAVQQRIRTQLQRFRLWGSDFDAREGGLDDKIANSDRVKDVLLQELGRLANALINLAHQLKQDTELEGVVARFKILNDQYLRTDHNTGAGEEDHEHDLLYSASVLDEITSSGSEVSTIDESSEIDELLQDIRFCNDCLFGLGSVLQDSAESIVPEFERADKSTAVNPSLLHNTAWAYISSVLEAYPSIDRDLAQRLGEANEQRYNRLQTRRDKATAKDPVIETDSSSEESAGECSAVQTDDQGSTGFAQSESTVPSTELSSVFDTITLSRKNLKGNKNSKAPLSVTTFASSLDGNNEQRRGRGLPKMPDDQPWGTAFNCTLCGDKLSNVWSSAEWVRHVYRDLQPYICTFPDCTSGHDTFYTSHEWSSHEIRAHRKHIAWACGQCKPGESIFTSEAQLRSHFPTRHGALTPVQISAVVRQASETVAKRITKERCPFCLTCPAATLAQYISHVSRHLQEVAHAAIPMSLMSEDNESLESFDSSNNEDQVKGDADETSNILKSPNSTASAVAGDIYNTPVADIHTIISRIDILSKRLSNVRRGYENDAHNIMTMIRQLLSIRGALIALYTWRASDAATTEVSTQLDKDLGLSLSCCAILIAVIDGKLTESGYTPNRGSKQRIRYRWLEDILGEYISNLEGQERALQLLTTIFQCRSASEQKQRIDKEESGELIEQARADTSTLELEGSDIDDTMSVLSEDPSVHLDVDPILMQSSIYQKTFAKLENRLAKQEKANALEQARPSAIVPRLNRNESLETYASDESSISVDLLHATTPSIRAILDRLKRLAIQSNGVYRSERERLAFSKHIEELCVSVETLQSLFTDAMSNPSHPRYARLLSMLKSSKQINDGRDVIDGLSSSLSRIEKRLEPIRGFRANARSLLKLQDKKVFKETIAQITELRDKVEMILGYDLVLVSVQEESQYRGSDPMYGVKNPRNASIGDGGDRKGALRTPSVETVDESETHIENASVILDEWVNSPKHASLKTMLDGENNLESKSI